MEKTKESELIGQGSYGCVFRPSISSQGISENDGKYLSKLQLSGETLDNEISIGEKIKTIPNYEEYFSPILEKYPIRLEQIKIKEIENCEITNNSKKQPDMKLFLDKLKYVGKNSLQNYLSIMKKGEPKKFVELFLESHIILLESLEKLNEMFNGAYTLISGDKGLIYQK